MNEFYLDDLCRMQIIPHSLLTWLLHFFDLLYVKKEKKKKEQKQNQKWTKTEPIL